MAIKYTIQVGILSEYHRISFKISKNLLKDFDEVSKSKGYQRREKAIIDLIKSEIAPK